MSDELMMHQRSHALDRVDGKVNEQSKALGVLVVSSLWSDRCNTPR
jgi:hypothetical protein